MSLGLQAMESRQRHHGTRRGKTKETQSRMSVSSWVAGRAVRKKKKGDLVNIGERHRSAPGTGVHRRELSRAIPARPSCRCQRINSYVQSVLVTSLISVQVISQALSDGPGRGAQQRRAACVEGRTLYLRGSSRPRSAWRSCQPLANQWVRRSQVAPVVCLLSNSVCTYEILWHSPAVSRLADLCLGSESKGWAALGLLPEPN